MNKFYTLTGQFGETEMCLNCRHSLQWHDDGGCYFDEQNPGSGCDCPITEEQWSEDSQKVEDK